MSDQRLAIASSYTLHMRFVNANCLFFSNLVYYYV